MPTCLITGVTGQDGAYLSQFMLEKGYRVWAADITPDETPLSMSTFVYGSQSIPGRTPCS